VKVAIDDEDLLSLRGAIHLPSSCKKGLPAQNRYLQTDITSIRLGAALGGMRRLTEYPPSSRVRPAARARLPSRLTSARRSAIAIDSPPAPH
jgi:hypothetical protein